MKFPSVLMLILCVLCLYPVALADDPIDRGSEICFSGDFAERGSYDDRTFLVTDVERFRIYFSHTGSYECAVWKIRDASGGLVPQGILNDSWFAFTNDRIGEISIYGGDSGISGAELNPGLYRIAIRHRLDVGIVSSRGQYTVKVSSINSVQPENAEYFEGQAALEAADIQGRSSYTVPFTVKEGSSYTVNGTNSGVTSWIIDADQLDEFEGGETFLQYSNFKTTRNTGPGFFELTLLPGEYYMAFFNESFDEQVVSFEIFEWKNRVTETVSISCIHYNRAAGEVQLNVRLENDQYSKVDITTRFVDAQNNLPLSDGVVNTESVDSGSEKTIRLNLPDAIPVSKKLKVEISTESTKALSDAVLVDQDPGPIQVRLCWGHDLQGWNLYYQIGSSESGGEKLVLYSRPVADSIVEADDPIAFKSAFRNSLQETFNRVLGEGKIMIENGAPIAGAINMYFLKSDSFEFDSIFSSKVLGKALTGINRFGTSRSGAAVCMSQIVRSGGVDYRMPNRKVFQVTVHEIGHCLGLRHIEDQSGEVTSSMDNVFWAGPSIDPLFSQNLLFMNEPIAGADMDLLTHNPTYHLRRWIGGEPHDTLVSQGVLPGSWDVLYCEDAEKDLTGLYTEGFKAPVENGIEVLSATGPAQPIFNVIISQRGGDLEGGELVLETFERLFPFELAGKKWIVSQGAQIVISGRTEGSEIQNVEIILEGGEDSNFEGFVVDPETKAVSPFVSGFLVETRSLLPPEIKIRALTNKISLEISTNGDELYALEKSVDGKIWDVVRESVKGEKVTSFFDRESKGLFRLVISE